MEGKCRTAESPRTEAWHPHLQSCEPRLEQKSHHNGERDVATDLKRLAPSSADPRKCSSPGSILSPETDWARKRIRYYIGITQEKDKFHKGTTPHPQGEGKGKQTQEILKDEEKRETVSFP